MKLYYIPASCSLAVHIVLREVGADFELERYDPASGETESGAAYAAINAKVRVPALTLGEGTVLTEGSSVMQYVVALHPASELALPEDVLARARVQEGLSFVASELHKSFSPFFASDMDEAGRSRARALVTKHLDFLEGVFADGRSFFVDNRVSIADIYLFVVLRWVAAAGLDLGGWEKVNAFRSRMAARPHTRAALRAEGLLKAA